MCYEAKGLPAPTASAAARILLVEDHPDTAILMRRILARRGYDVIVASGAAEAVALLDDTPPPDLLISDLRLPDGSGCDLMRELKRRRPSVPGIVVSGCGSPDDLRATRDAGFAAHLIKPVDVEKLFDVIGRLAPLPTPAQHAA